MGAIEYVAIGVVPPGPSAYGGGGHDGFGPPQRASEPVCVCRGAGRLLIFGRFMFLCVKMFRCIFGWLDRSPRRCCYPNVIMVCWMRLSFSCSLPLSLFRSCVVPMHVLPLPASFFVLLFFVLFFVLRAAVSRRGLTTHSCTLPLSRSGSATSLTHTRPSSRSCVPTKNNKDVRVIDRQSPTRGAFLCPPIQRFAIGQTRPDSSREGRRRPVNKPITSITLGYSVLCFKNGSCRRVVLCIS